MCRTLIGCLLLAMLCAGCAQTYRQCPEQEAPLEEFFLPTGGYDEGCCVSEIYWLERCEIDLPPYTPENLVSNDRARAERYSQSSSGRSLGKVNALVFSANMQPFVCFLETSEDCIHLDIAATRYPELWEGEKGEPPSLKSIEELGCYGLDFLYLPDGSHSPNMAAIIGFDYTVNEDSVDLRFRRWSIAYSQDTNGDFVDNVEFYMSNQLEKRLKILRHERFSTASWQANMSQTHVSDTPPQQPNLAAQLYLSAEHKRAPIARVKEHMQELAEAGDLDAQYLLGWVYLLPHPEKSREMAAKCWLRAAEQGHARAQFDLAYRYYNEPTSGHYDPEEARKWFQKAADQGDEGAQLELKKLSGEKPPIVSFRITENGIEYLDPPPEE